MPWLPRYIISGGLYGDRLCPAGSLNELRDLCPTRYDEGNAYCSFTGYMNNDYPNYDEWGSRYGMNGDLYREYAKNNDDGNIHTYFLVEIPIKNPTGAQFYKQSIVFYFNSSSNTQTINEGMANELNYTNYSITLVNIKRREYPTPYSAYTEEELANNVNVGITSAFYNYGDYEAGSFYLEFTRDIVFALGTFNAANKEYFGLAIYESHERSDRFNKGWGASCVAVSIDNIEEHFGTSELEETDDPNEDPEEPGNDEDGGDGEHNRPVDDILIPPLPDLGAVDAGFITLYHLSPAEMWNFAQHFFAESLLDVIRLYFNNPMDIFVSAGILPFTPTGNSMWYPKIGGAYISSQALQKVDDQFYEIDCGDIYIEKYGNNCFDFSPYTKISIFLPYIGYRELAVDEVMGEHVHVVYHCDVLSGDCVAFVSTKIARKGLNVPADVVIGQYTGNCLTQIPVGSVSFDQMVRGIIDLCATGISAGAHAIGSSLSGDEGGSKSSTSLSASAAAIVAGDKPTVKTGGVIGGTSGYMSIQKPYIMREIPNQSLPDNYGLFFGYPSNRSGTLGDGHFTGFAMVEDIQLNDIPAMETERTEILDWLKKGVLL